ncbi:MAG: hypothetical protein HOV80_08415 [Polyangiaceae bacterium]|nr:hypothetical protein [Polyangiaceae bacterium]
MTTPLASGDVGSVALARPAAQYDGPLTVVLIAIDGVRWQEIFEGTDPALLREGKAKSAGELAPNIHALARRGVALGAPGHGAPFVASGPNFVSLPGYTEMLTGRPAPCQENDCNERPSWTLLDAFASKGGAVGAIASWTPISRVAASDPKLGAVSAGRNGGVTREKVRTIPGLAAVFDAAAIASPSPGHDDYRPDEYTAPLALGYLKKERPRFLFVGLGDTDEYGHRGNYDAYIEALGAADKFVGDVMATADAWRKEGHATIIVVTTDHGRSRDFEDHGRKFKESARSWLVAGGGPIPARGYVSSPRERGLRDLAPTLAAVGGVPMEVRAGSGRILYELLP